MSTNTHVAVLRDRRGRIVDAQPFEMGGPYSWYLDSIARSMVEGDELKVERRRLSAEDLKAIAVKQAEKDKEGEAAEREREIQSLRDALAKAEAGEPMSKVRAELDLETDLPF